MKLARRIGEKLWGTFTFGPSARALRKQADPDTRRIVDVVAEAVAGNSSPTERQWIDRIEQIRKQMLASDAFGGCHRRRQVTRRLHRAGAPRTLTVQTGRFAAAATANWFDPTSGRYTAVAGSPFKNRGRQRITAPARNQAGDGDWVLVIEAAP